MTEPSGADSYGQKRGEAVQRAHLLLISGSTRPGSSNTAALRAVATVAPGDISTELYTGLEKLPAFVPGDQPSPPAVAELRERLAAADAVLFCTPEYAGLIPGSLKNLLEWTVGTADLYEKPVAWINVAAPGRGEGAIESLRTVLGYVGATIIDNACVRITVPHGAVESDGTVSDSNVRAELAATITAIGKYLDR
ncbi:NADPH-dependent FMN reductase [Nocardia pseudobrasiliensis]|uniref:NADPH-dependent FMN reductase n=1 Tax=Nocardia pseudobrasiliensis TaxID=45979 RepID=UPI001FEBD4B9|nr:NAD(P)H-dependent oxidoreductase [Nocardia pseudobrasiliensis]